MCLGFVFLIQFPKVIKCLNFSACTPKILCHFLNADDFALLRSVLAFIANSLQNIFFLFFCSTLDRKRNKNQQESDIGNTAKFPSSRLACSFRNPLIYRTPFNAQWASLQLKSDVKIAVLPITIQIEHNVFSQVYQEC